MTFVFDAHTHVVPAHIESAPDRPGWPQVVQDGDGAASVTIDGRLFRRIDSRCWDVERRLADMRADGVDGQAISPMPELLSHWFEAGAAEGLADIVNADIDRMVAAAPGRFVGIGMVCMQDPTRAVRQIERLAADGFRGFEVGSHINGVPLGSPSLWPIYEAAEAARLVVFVHPLHPVGAERMGLGGEYGAVAAFPLETALAAVSLLGHGVLDRFPDLQILLSHGGGALPWILPRLDQGFGLSVAMKAAMRSKPSDLARRFWYDTILYSEQSLRFLTEAVGVDQIVVGSDYPFTIKQDRPGEIAARALGCDAPCLNANAARLLRTTFDVARRREDAI